MPVKGVNYLVFKRYGEDGEVVKMSSKFLADKKSVIPLSTLEETFKELKIEEIRTTANGFKLKDLVKNTKTGGVINMGKLFKLIPKDAQGVCEFRIYPDVPANDASDKKNKVNYNMFISFLANKLWMSNNTNQVIQAMNEEQTNIFSECIMTYPMPGYPKVLILVNQKDVIISFGPQENFVGIEQIRSLVMSIPMYTILEKLITDKGRGLIITGTLFGGVAAQLLTLQILESEETLPFELSCITYNTPAFMGVELFNSFGNHNDCFINIIQKEYIPFLALISSLEYTENMSDELKLTEDIQTTLNSYIEAKRTNKKALKLSVSSTTKLVSLLNDSTICYVGDVTLLEGQGTFSKFPCEDYDMLNYSLLSGGASLVDLINSEQSLGIDSNLAITSLSQSLMNLLKNNGFTNSHISRIPRVPVAELKEILPKVNNALLSIIQISNKQTSLRFTLTGQNLDSAFNPVEDNYSYMLGAEEGQFPFYLNYFRDHKITCYVESMTPKEVMIRTSPTPVIKSDSIDGKFNTIFGSIPVMFKTDGAKHRNLSNAEMKQLGLSVEGMLRIVGILMLDLEEEKRTKKKIRSNNLSEALLCLQRIEILSRGIHMDDAECILVNTIEEELKKDDPDITRVITVATPIINSFIEVMSKPLLVPEKSLGERLGIAFKARLSLITGGFLKKIGKHNKSIAYKGELMSEYARHTLNFGEANIRYNSILQLLAFILSEEENTIGCNLAELESKVVEKYNSGVYDHSLVSGDIAKPFTHLEEVIRERLRLLEFQKSTNMEYMSILQILTKKEYKETLTDLTTRLLGSGQLCALRDTFARAVCISFVGTHNAGKSTMMQNLFNIDTDPSFFERTLQVSSFRPPVYHAVKNDKEQAKRQVFFTLMRSDLRFLDFPGASDERENIRAQTSLLLGLSTLVVVVFNAVHIAQPECEIMDLVKSKELPYIVLLNQVDKVINNLRLENRDIEHGNENENEMPTSIEERTGANNSLEESIQASLKQLRINSAKRLGVDESSIRLTSSFDTAPVKVDILSRLKNITSIEKRNLSILLAGDLYKIIINQSDEFIRTVYKKIEEEDDSYLFRENTINSYILSVKIEKLRGPDPDWHDFVKPAEVPIFELLVRRKKLTKEAIINKLLEEYQKPNATLPSNNLELFGINDASSIPPFTWEDVEAQEVYPKGVAIKIDPSKPVTCTVQQAREWLSSEIAKRKSPGRIFLRASSTDPDMFINSVAALTVQDLRNDVVCKDDTEAIDCGGVIVSYLGGLCQQINVLASKKEFEPLQSSNANTIYLSPDFERFDENLKKQFDRYVKVVFKLIMLVLSQCSRTKTFLLSCNLSHTIFKIILGYPLTVNDIQSINVSSFNMIKAIASAAVANNVDDMYLETTLPSPSETYCQEFIWPNKEDQQDLTNDNVSEYITSCVMYLLWANYDFGPLLRDLNAIVSIAGLQAHFTPETLRLFCCGSQHIDKSDLISNIDFPNFDENNKTKTRKTWLNTLISGLNDNEASLFVGFFTGTLAPPLGGFASLKPKMSIFLDDGAPESNLPIGSTCFNRMTIPIYPTYNVMKEKIIMAISNCSNTEFGLK